MSVLTSDIYLHFLIVTILVFSAAALFVGALWSLPSGWKTYRYWRGRDTIRRVYSFWRLARTTIAYVSLLAFFFVPLVVLLFPDPADPIRAFLSRHLLVVVVLGLSLLVISEPVSERRVDAAIAREEENGA